jgi:hypothetical protein
VQSADHATWREFAAVLRVFEPCEGGVFGLFFVVDVEVGEALAGGDESAERFFVCPRRSRGNISAVPAGLGCRGGVDPALPCWAKFESSRWDSGQETNGTRGSSRFTTPCIANAMRRT